jgi:hypothetical protein
MTSKPDRLHQGLAHGDAADIDNGITISRGG